VRPPTPGVEALVQFVVREAMCVLLPPAHGFPGVAGTDVRGFVERLARDSSATFWLGVVLGSWVIVLSPLITVLVPLPTFWLGESLRDRHASRLIGHPFYLIRQAAFLVKMMAGMCWGMDPVVRERLKIPPVGPDPGTWRTT
jgi:hypothetical protein